MPFEKIDCLKPLSSEAQNHGMRVSYSLILIVLLWLNFLGNLL